MMSSRAPFASTPAPRGGPLGTPNYGMPPSQVGPAIGSMQDLDETGYAPTSYSMVFSRESYDKQTIGTGGDIIFTLNKKNAPVEVNAAADCYTLGALNAYLASAEGREKYGKDYSAARLTRDVRMLGVQMTRDSDHLKQSRLPVTTVVLGNVAPEVADVCLGRGGGAKPRITKRGDQIYVLVVKVDVPVPGIVQGATAKAWKYVAVSTTDGRAPPVHQYSHFNFAYPGEAWLGACLYLGLVTTHYGNLTGANQVDAAIGASFPATGDGERRDAAARLARIDVAVGIGG